MDASPPPAEGQSEAADVGDANGLRAQPATARRSTAPVDRRRGRIARRRQPRDPSPRGEPFERHSRRSAPAVGVIDPPTARRSGPVTAPGPRTDQLDRPSPSGSAAFSIPVDSPAHGRIPVRRHARRRPPTSAAMHAANRAAWDEAAERYEGWFDEAVELIRAGGSNLFPVEHDLIGDLRGTCRRAIHLQCAGGRDTLSLWNLGADEVVGVDFSPRMLDLARRLTEATGAPATLGRGGRPRRPARAGRHRRPPLHGPRRDHLAPGPRRAGRPCCAGCSRRTGGS